MAVRVGPPWARRLVALLSMFVPLAAIGHLPAGAPDVVGTALLAGVVGFPLALFHVFGVMPVASE